MQSAATPIEMYLPVTQRRDSQAKTDCDQLNTGECITNLPTNEGEKKTVVQAPNPACYAHEHINTYKKQQISASHSFFG